MKADNAKEENMKGTFKKLVCLATACVIALGTASEEDSVQEQKPQEQPEE